MPNYILAYHGGEQPKTPEAGAKHMSRYKEWLGSLGETLVNPPSPFGKKCQLVLRVYQNARTQIT